MSLSPSRPTVEVSDVILDSMDRMFAQLVDRLDGLTNSEDLWEPAAETWSVRAGQGDVPLVDGAGERDVDPAPVTTIAWRLWHIAVDCFDDYTRRFSGDTADASAVWTLDADEAIEILQQKWTTYRSVIAGRDWWDELGDTWGYGRVTPPLTWQCTPATNSSTTPQRSRCCAISTERPSPRSQSDDGQLKATDATEQGRGRAIRTTPARSPPDRS